MAESNKDRFVRTDFQLMKRIWQFVRPHWRPLLLSIVLIPVAAVLSLLPPYLLKLAIDDAIIVGDAAALAPIALAFIAVTVGEAIAAFGQSLAIQVTGQRACHDLRKATHAHAIRLNIPYFDRTPVGKLMTRVTNDIESVAEAFAAGVVALVGDVLKVVGVIIAMLWLHPGLTLLALSVLPVLVLVVLWFQRLLRRAYREVRAMLARINATMQEQISGIRVIQIFSREHHAATQFDDDNRAYRDTFKRAIKYDATLFSLVEFLGSVAIALVLWYGGLRALSQSQGLSAGVTVGVVIAFIEYVRKLFEPLRDLSAKYAVMQQALAAAERVFGLLDTDAPDCPPITDQGQLRDTSTAGTSAGRRLMEGQPSASFTAQQKVRFADLHFAYPGQPALFRQLNLNVQSGQTVALVGPTGSGKSSVIRLLTRMYEWQSGSICLDGQDIRTLDRVQLRRRVVVLSQDFYLFTGTVAQNITLGDPEITPQMVDDAARRVGLLRVTSLDEEVGERGRNLSMGQRQLVVFARALARDPEVLVLDEATASVDPEAEELIQVGISTLLKERTAIVIAHRLSTVERADHVLVLHNGELVQQGTPHQLAADHQGLYARLRRLQYV